jgi:hypothetical protein
MLREHEIEKLGEMVDCEDDVGCPALIYSI